MKDAIESIVMFVLVITAVFLFSGPDPTVFQVLQAHVRGTCK